MPYEETQVPATIAILDHGFVRLVDHMGDDLSVVRAARVSHDAAWRAGEDTGSDERLIRYLWRNKHTSPFEHVTFTFEVKAPIFVLRQWMRHRTWDKIEHDGDAWSYNEVSARYKEIEADEYYMPEVKVIGQQATINKQGRKHDPLDAEHALLLKNDLRAYGSTCDEAFRRYHDLLERGWPRELARCVLPVATYSHMFATVNLLNLMRFLTLRCDAHAQHEIRVYADALRTLAYEVAPVCMAAWEDTRIEDFLRTAGAHETTGL